MKNQQKTQSTNRLKIDAGKTRNSIKFRPKKGKGIHPVIDTKLIFSATAHFRENHDYSWSVCLKPRLGTSKKQQKLNNARKKIYPKTCPKKGCNKHEHGAKIDLKREQQS